MQLSEVVASSRAVAATRSRKVKTSELVRCLTQAPPDELPAAIAFLSGEPRQERLDLGPAAVWGEDVPPAGASSLTVGDVDDALQAIAEVPAGAGSRTTRIAVLTDLLARATADEQDWLRHLVVRELRQGSLAGVLIGAIAAAADVDVDVVRRAAMLSGSLVDTATVALTDGAVGLRAFRLQVGTALEPMLAASATSVAEAVRDATAQLAPHAPATTEVVVEAKLDGARVQVHRHDHTVHVYTRNLRDVTHRMPEVVAAARSLPVAAVVLDGEVLALDRDGRPRAFQDTMSRVGREHGDDHELALTVRFFDVLHVDGTDVLDRPLTERLDVLRRTVPPDLRVDQLVTADVTAAEAFAADTLAAGHEGVMVKALHAPYEAGRRGASWRKVKPVHTLDLVVIAAEWGSGRRRGWLSNLHLAARVEDDGPPQEQHLVMLGKTFKGLTDETLAWQTEALLGREERRDGHVVHVRPELVVEVALDGFVRSIRYPGGLAMRFARVRGYRPDRDASTADTLATARAIASGERAPSR